MSIAGILTDGRQDAAELLSSVFLAAGSAVDDFSRIKTISRNSALGLLGRSISLGKRLCQTTKKGQAVGTLPIGPDLIDDCFSRYDESREVQNCLNPLREATSTHEGEFAAILALDSDLVGLRDPLGKLPLFYTRTESLIALSSSKKILWMISDAEPQVHQSGTMTHFTSQTVGSYRIREVCLPEATKIVTFEETCIRLSRLIVESVKAAAGHVKKVGVLFSGGLDSSTIASAAKLLGLETCLYTAAFDDPRFLLQAKEAARMLDLNLNARLLDEEETEEALKHAVWAAESADPLQVSVALPLDAATQAAVREGETVLLSGSGADELFGGYARYNEVFMQLGARKLLETMHKDVLRLGETDLLRDGAIGESNRIQLLSPFLNLRLVDLALGMPVAFKLRGPGECLNKHILREAAKRLEVPAEVTDSQKKAAQYSSGSLKALRIMARKKGVRVQELLDSVLANLRRDLEEKMHRFSA